MTESNEKLNVNKRECSESKKEKNVNIYYLIIAQDLLISLIREKIPISLKFIIQCIFNPRQLNLG